MNSYIHSLQSLGVEQGSYSSLICPVLVGKLPSDMQLLISRKVSDDDWKLDSLIEAEVSARERINIEQSRPPPRRKDPPPSVTSLVSGGTSSVSSPCCYCNKLHMPINCDVVLQVEAKHGGSQDLQVFVVPHICHLVTSEAAVSCVKMYRHLSQHQCNSRQDHGG